MWVAAPARAGALAPEDRAAAGDRSATAEAEFRLFHQRTARPLWAYLVATCRDRALADDVLQESYLRLLQAPGAPSDEEGRRRYLFRIATNLLHDAHRSASRLVPLAEQSAEPATPASAATGDVERALAELPARERRLLWLAHVEGYSHQEIAETTGVRAGSVRVLLFRARQKLAARLRARGLGDEE